MKKFLLTALGCAVLAVPASPALAGTPQPFFNGFETDTHGWYEPTPTRVPSGTDGINAATGDYYATVPFGRWPDGSSYTDWGGFPTSWPAGGYTTSVDVYLDPAGLEADNTPNDVRFDWDSSFPRDFVFHGGYYNDSGPYGSGPRFDFSPSNNSPGNPRDAGRDPFVITDTGWYTLQHHFTDNDGVIAVEMSILDATGHVLKSWTLSTSSDLTSNGGFGYGWFSHNEFPSLAIDNSRLTVSIHEAKEGVRNDLEDLAQGASKKDADHIDKAIDHINKSLAAKLWDGSGLTKYGNQVFDEEKVAVGELGKVKDTDVSAQIAQLVNIDRTLAQDAIDAAGDAKAIDKANDEMAKGDAADKPGDAIEHYKHAWERAFKA